LYTLDHDLRTERRCGVFSGAGMEAFPCGVVITPKVRPAIKVSWRAGEFTAEKLEKGAG
jgi:hypothetical protein